MRTPGVFKSICDVWASERDPRSFAGGIAVGLFVGFLPIPVAQAAFAFGAAHLLRVSRLAAAAASLLTNPFTMPFVFPAAIWLGSALVPGVETGEMVPRSWSMTDLATASGTFLVSYTVGTTLIGAAVAPIGYVVALRLSEARVRKLDEENGTPNNGSSS